ncbi:MAG: hypothetical protein KJP25_08385 [Gammaproteobacteria bacterium]|nr:hypothetical protein [Gammaproteobacteria bacterium]
MDFQNNKEQDARGSLLFLHAPVKILSEETLSGANIYHDRSVACIRIDFGPLAEISSCAMDSSFSYAYLRRFVSLPSFIPLNGLDKIFVEKLRRKESVAFPQLLLEAILSIETHLAREMHDLETVDFAVVDNNESGTSLVWESKLPRLSLKVAQAATLGLLELLPRQLDPEQGKRKETFEQHLAELEKLVRRRRLAASTSTLKYAARKRGIPCKLLGRQHLLLGEGMHQARLFASMSGTTSSAAQKSCADKRQTNRLLRDLRLPCTRQVRVGSEEETLIAIEKLGYPLVVKPQKGNRGRDVFVKLSSPFEALDAFNRAHQKGRDVIIERYVPGTDHRLLVVGNRCVAALKKLPPCVIGDGHSTIEKLIDELNQDPLRDGFRRYVIKKDVDLQERLLANGLTFSTVLEENKKVTLRDTANISTGGLPIDVTDRVHPDNFSIAERAARGMDLDVAGIDFITEDISRSYKECGGAIIEINARPGLCIHTWPAEGKPRNVASKVLDLSFPAAGSSRIPVLAVAGDKGIGTVARYLDLALRATGRSVALALTKEASVNGRPAELNPRQQEQAPLVLLRDPDIDTLVTTVSLRKTVRRGMLLERTDVSVIMDRQVNGDAKQFATGLDVLCNATDGCYVVDASNSLALGRLSTTDPAKIVLVSDQANNARLEQHKQAGHKVVSLQWHEKAMAILLWSEGKVVASFNAEVGSSRDGRTRKNRLKNGKMLAIAAAFALGIPAQDLASVDHAFQLSD